jgi:hypothetical protein
MIMIGWCDVEYSMGCGCNYNGCVVQDMLHENEIRDPLDGSLDYVGSRDSRDLTFGRLFRRAMFVGSLTSRHSQW